MSEGDVITVGGLRWYRLEAGRYVLCNAPEGVFATVSSHPDGGWCIGGFMATSLDYDPTPDLFLREDGNWYTTRDDAMKAVAAWVVTLRLQGKIKEKEDD